jgi:hypothetical protein
MSAGPALIAAPADAPRKIASHRLLAYIMNVATWAVTMVFVGVGWLLFFYPAEKAATMAFQLFMW